MHFFLFKLSFWDGNISFFLFKQAWLLSFYSTIIIWNEEMDYIGKTLMGEIFMSFIFCVDVIMSYLHAFFTFSRECDM
jgi:hypothetical protein